ncbi:MAG: aminotransferase class I/II-fold pyridoxal phosphate-dependent enzyme, partial [Paracoccus sp. (in: a-proteobacteria)]|nr:aminotransferase class I/II-fold pyridoxal phosphate-dependent enzyme [Paracoccus sp. (in: a-proteobacteria)]
LPMAGASAPILLLPRLLRPRRAAVLSPTYNEHAASLRAAGCEVSTPAQVQALAGADLAVVVNPNNPDGRCFSPGEIAEIAGRCRWLIVDESFADPRPDLSVAGLGLPNVIVLRSFGKFWGLAGLRLGFAIGPPEVLDGLQELAGPWPVSGPALEIGVIALADRTWASETVTWLSEAALRLDQLALRAGFQLVGGAHLFRLYQTGDAIATQARLAQAQIWSRVFPYHPGWIRLGIPGNSGEFDRVGAALNDL